MSRLISQLLGAREPLFGLSIQQLEDLTGHPGIDIRLSSEIINTVRLKISQLNLDPSDTTGEELYQVLQNKIRDDDIKLLEKIGFENTPKTPELNNCLKGLLDSQINHKTWLLKRSVAKELVRQHPPRRVITAMGYRSVDNMIKNESIYEIFAALRFAESPAWLNKFISFYKIIKPSDFEQRPIEIIILPADRWLKLSKAFVVKKKHNVTHLKELGVVAILPTSDEYREGTAIAVVPLVVHYLNEIMLYSSYLKLHQVKPNFGDLLSGVIVGDSGPIAKIANQHIHWRILQRYYGKTEDANKHPEIFEPHVQPEDLHWRKAERVLYEIDDNLGWWQDLDYVGILDQDLPVTFNMMDNVINFYNKNKYNNRNFYHFRESLWNELFVRYLGEKTLENQILHQLGMNLIHPEDIKLNRRKIKI